MGDEKLENIKEGRLFDLSEKNRALLIGVFDAPQAKASCEEQLKELESLCDTYGIETAIVIPYHLRRIESATFLGSGKVEELAKLCEEENIDVVIFDDEISPHQQRNLETVLKRFVIDRTELILGVFAKHAKTKEAMLQIALAQARYQLPRLKRLWTHLSRQKTGGGGGSGGGYLKGTGETQIETDRRILKDKIFKLQTKLLEIKKQREVQRSQRVRTNIPTFSIIGYTNSGKSTLLNALTGADVLVEDKLFATLDTTTRKFTLPNNQQILLIDTVGFIRKIPHGLVAAFKSTLEEATFADILLHLVDASSPYALVQAEASMLVLKELKSENKPMITVLNKIDKSQDRSVLMKLKLTYPKTVEISALKKEGFQDLLKMMMQEISKLRKTLKLKIPQSHYALVSMIMKEGRVISKEYLDNYILLEVEIPQNLESKVEEFVIL